jgi:hypothetical protein
MFLYIKRIKGMLSVKGATRGERRGQDLKGAVDHFVLVKVKQSHYRR